jgi:HPt (histidine-containing phosphotransfer) domain-containing protein
LASQPLRTDLLGSEIATPVLWLLTIVLLIAWFFSHRFKDRIKTKPLQLGMLAGRVILGMVALWALYQAISRHLFLESSWLLWTNAFIGALAVEFALLVYQFEKRLLPAWLGKLLLTLRTAALATVLIILLQPVFARDENRVIERKVVVLVDDSGSMQIADPQMTVAEKISLAGFYGVDALKDRPSLDPLFAEFSATVTKMDQAVTKLTLPDGFGSDSEEALLQQQQEPLAALMKDIPASVEKLRKGLQAQDNLPNEAKQLIKDLEKSLNDPFSERLREANKRLEQKRLREVQAPLRQARDLAQRFLPNGLAGNSQNH